MRIVADGLFDIYVYANEVMHSHHYPHCHVLSTNGDTVVGLPDMNIIVGKQLPKRATTLVIENIEKICDAWNELNPEMCI